MSGSEFPITILDHRKNCYEIGCGQDDLMPIISSTHSWLFALAKTTKYRSCFILPTFSQYYRSYDPILWWYYLKKWAFPHHQLQLCSAFLQFHLMLLFFWEHLNQTFFRALIAGLTNFKKKYVQRRLLLVRPQKLAYLLVSLVSFFRPGIRCSWPEMYDIELVLFVWTIGEAFKKKIQRPALALEQA